MNYYKDAEKQLNEIISNNVNLNVVELYPMRIKKIFQGVFIINYIANRVEFRQFFSSVYFNIFLSCLMESFSLILNNYPRGSALVLRSGLENFTKFIIEANGKEGYYIDDRSYSKNKATISKIITNEYISSLVDESNSLNGKMESEYRKLSGLSHSLTTESKENVINYFSDMDIIIENNIELVLEKIEKIINYVFSFCVIMRQPSFKLWESSDFSEILGMVFGSRRVESFINMIKI